jgi:Sec-independent protein translocase protein TatA
LKKTATEFENYCEQLQWFPAGFDASTYEVRLHTDKIDERLRPFFRQFSKDTDKDGFFKIPEKIANGYMFFLSDTVSKRRNIPKLTDNPDMFAAMTYFDGDGDFDELFIDTEAEELYSNLIIENLLPADIRSINMERIIELHKNLENYKKEFRKAVSDFNEKLSKIEDSSFAQKEIEKFKKELLNSKQTRIEILKSYFQELSPSLLYVGVPTCAASIVGSVFTSKDDVFGIAEIAKGIILGGVASFANAGKDIRKKWTSKKSNYYLEVRKELTSTENSKIRVYDVSKLLDEFIND